MKWRLGLALIGCALGLLGLEVAARIWVALRWPSEKTFMLTHQTETRGRYTYDSLIGFRLTPGFRDRSGRYSHNSYGFRGPDFPLEKPADGLRVVMLGGSTVYGVRVKDNQTSAAQLEGRLRARLPGRPVEVLNAGVAGYTSQETLGMLRHRVLNLRPDIVVIVDGRNEVFPELFNNYRDDYSHFRTPGYRFRDSNYWHKKLFRVSHLFMMLAAAESGRFGFSYLKEDPTYSSIDYRNQPTAVELVRNAAELRRLETYRRHLAEEIGTARARGVRIVLSTIAFYAPKYGSGIIVRDPRTLPAIAEEVARNNAIVRAVARDSNVTLVNAETLAGRPDLLVDDCHFNPEGEAAFADLLLNAIYPLVAAGRARQTEGRRS